MDRPYWGTPLKTGPDGVVRGTGRILDGTRFKNYNVNDGLYEQSVLWARSLTEWRAGANLTLKNTLYYYRAERDYRNLENYRLNAGNSLVLRSGALLQRHEQSLLGNRVEGLYRSTLAGLPSDWSFGADFSENKVTRYPTSLPAQVDAVDPYDFAAGDFYDIPGMTRGHVADRDNRIPVSGEAVVDARLNTMIENAAGVRLSTIEHLMAAFAALAANGPYRTGNHFYRAAPELIAGFAIRTAVGISA